MRTRTASSTSLEQESSAIHTDAHMANRWNWDAAVPFLNTPNCISLHRDDSQHPLWRHKRGSRTTFGGQSPEKTGLAISPVRKIFTSLNAVSATRSRGRSTAGRRAANEAAERHRIRDAKADQITLLGHRRADLIIFMWGQRRHPPPGPRHRRAALPDPMMRAYS